MGTRRPIHLLCHALQLLLDVRKEESEESFIVSAALVQPAGVVLQEATGDLLLHVGCSGWHGAGGWGPGVGAHQAVLMDAEPVLTARVSVDVRVVLCPLAQPAPCNGDKGIITPSTLAG